MPFCKKLFYLSAHTCPFRWLRRHLSQRQSVSLTFTVSLRSSKSGSLASRQAGTAYGLYSFSFYSLLLHRSAPRKVVRLLPDKRGRLTFRILPFVFKQRGRLVKWRFLFLLRSRQIFCVSHFFIFCFSSYKNRLFDRRFFFVCSVFKNSCCYSPLGTVFPLFSTK